MEDKFLCSSLCAGILGCEAEVLGLSDGNLSNISTKFSRVIPRLVKNF